MPWSELLALIAPHAPVAKTGRPPFDLAMMLCIHCLQQWFGLSDLGAEEALFETGFYRALVGISGTQRIADRVSILRFRHLLEAHELSPKILQVINANSSPHGMTCSISSSRICLRVRRMLRSRPRSFCFMPSMPAIYVPPIQLIGESFEHDP